MDNCKKIFKNENINIEDFDKNLKKFCQYLKTENNEKIEQYFKTLPKSVQCLFIYFSKKILNNESIEEKYADTNENCRKIIDLFDRQEKKEIRSSTKSVIFDEEKKRRNRVKKIFDKEFQKKDSVESRSPLYLFYTSLFEENKNSKLAIKWLTEHGIFEGKERENLIKLYKNL